MFLQLFVNPPDVNSELLFVGIISALISHHIKITRCGIFWLTSRRICDAISFKESFCTSGDVYLLLFLVSQESTSTSPQVNPWRHNNCWFHPHQSLTDMKPQIIQYNHENATLESRVACSASCNFAISVEARVMLPQLHDGNHWSDAFWKLW